MLENVPDILGNVVAVAAALNATLNTSKLGVFGRIIEAVGLSVGRAKNGVGQ